MFQKEKHTMPDIQSDACSAGSKRWPAVAGIVLMLFVFSCSPNNKGYSEELSSLLAKRVERGDTLSRNDYVVIMDQLEGMLDIVFLKAEQIVDSGYHPEEVRKRLMFDAEYRKIFHDAILLDSAILCHMRTPAANPTLENRYYKTMNTFSRKASAVGLK